MCPNKKVSLGTASDVWTESSYRCPGCYQCSQRRIHCDRNMPECQKCLSKGIVCSGLGIRYRFIGDVASKRSHKNIPPKCARPISSYYHGQDAEHQDTSYSLLDHWDEVSTNSTNDTACDTWSSGDFDIYNYAYHHPNIEDCIDHVTPENGCASNPSVRYFEDEDVIEESDYIRITHLDAISSFQVSVLDHCKCPRFRNLRLTNRSSLRQDRNRDGRNRWCP